MRFGISKYFVDYEGRKVFCCGIERPSKEFLTEANESEYKTPWYLRIYDILQRDMKGGAVGETYLKRLKLVFKSRLHSWNLITASNPCAVAVVRYSATILTRTQLEIAECMVH